MGARTDNYPIVGTQDEMQRMKSADQVRPSVARQAIGEGLLVFGLCRDMKWRRVKTVGVFKRNYSSPTVFNIVFSEAGYVRQLTKDWILLVEVPSAVPGEQS